MVKQRYTREADGERLPDSRRRAVVADEVPARRPISRWTCKDFSAMLEHVLARTNPETDLYVFSNLVDGHAGLHGPEVNQGSKGCGWASAIRVRTLPREFSASDPPRRRAPTRASSVADAWCVGGPRLRG
ncbi:MAG: hypothetical protein QM736_04875 [Vicinamibacterales bacterium]